MENLVQFIKNKHADKIKVMKDKLKAGWSRKYLNKPLDIYKKRIILFI